MKNVLIAAMPGEAAPSRRLAAALDADVCEIDVHRFPDGESRVRAPRAGTTTILYQSLDRPNEKLIELGLAASALRNLGARRLVLVAPYLCYMRQDKAFQRGEAVSQRFVGELLARWFDRIVTMEPHLHRVDTLDDVFPETETTAISASALLADLIRRDGHGSATLIVGPDSESRRWVAAVASDVGAPFFVLEKTRRGDADVSVSNDDAAPVAGRRVCLVDDVASTGQTLTEAGKLLKEQGAALVEALVVHALLGDSELERMRQAGIDRIRSTDSVAHPTNAIEIAPLLAEALALEGKV